LRSDSGAINRHLWLDATLGVGIRAVKRGAIRTNMTMTFVVFGAQHGELLFFARLLTASPPCTPEM